MAITYPLTLPSVKSPTRVTLAATSVVGISRSPFTFTQQVFAYPGQIWGAGISLPVMLRSDADQWKTFLLKLNGQYGTFLLGDPSAPSAKGTALGTPLVKGASQTGQTLLTDGWTNSATGVLLAGDYIQLGTGAASRLHMVLVDVDADGSGNATIEIFPALRESPADNLAIVTEDCVGTFRLASNQMAVVNASGPIDNPHYALEFEAIEAI